jgi:hypothetical protein
MVISSIWADQTVLGKSFAVKAKPGDPTKTKVRALEKNSNDTLVGDPTAARRGPCTPGSAHSDQRAGRSIFALAECGETTEVKYDALGQKPFHS